jgi:Domain of unknown function (DUF4157)
MQSYAPKVKQAKSVVAPAGVKGQRPFLPAHDAGGFALGAVVRQKMERAFQNDFSTVRVHSGPEPHSIGALAFARGQHLYFAPGEYQPGTRKGRHLLGHELAHIVQQRSGRVPVEKGKHLPVNDSPALEREAEAAGTAVAGGFEAISHSASAGASIPAAAARPGSSGIQPGPIQRGGGQSRPAKPKEDPAEIRRQEQRIAQLEAQLRQRQETAARKAAQLKAQHELAAQQAQRDADVASASSSISVARAAATGAGALNQAAYDAHIQTLNATPRRIQMNPKVKRIHNASQAGSVAAGLADVGLHASQGNLGQAAATAVSTVGSLAVTAGKTPAQRALGLGAMVGGEVVKSYLQTKDARTKAAMSQEKAAQSEDD